jgi:hypothetical protein
MYTVSSLPDTSDSNSLALWIFAELSKLSGLLALIETGYFLEVSTAAPKKPRERQIVFADGTVWNPGSGKGFYGYYNSAWHFLG